MMPPNDARAEKAVIGSMLLNRGSIQVARQFVEAGHFYDSRNQVLFEAICCLHERGTGVDLTTLADALRTSAKLAIVGGEPYLAECIEAVSTVDHAEHYAKIVARCYFEREIIKTSAKMAADQDAAGLEVMRDLFLRKENLHAPATFTYRDSLHAALDEIAGDKKKGKLYRFGIPSIDKIVSGTKPGEINVFGAATNTGKSLLLLALMEKAASAGIRCLYVGTEMTARETFARHLGMKGNIPAWKIRNGKMTTDDVKKAFDVIADHLSKMDVAIFDHPEPSLRDIEAAIQHHKAEIVFLDYLERMSLPKADCLRLAVKEFMRQTKNMARRCDIVVHLASQLNRSTYGREKDCAPTLADLSESSAIEKEADRVFLFHQPADIQPIDQPGAWTGDRTIEVILAKDRHGPKGLTALLRLDGKTLKIEDADMEKAS